MFGGEELKGAMGSGIDEDRTTAFVGEVIVTDETFVVGIAEVVAVTLAGLEDSGAT